MKAAKKIVSSLLIAAMIISVTACGGNGGTSETTTTAGTQAKTDNSGDTTTSDGGNKTDSGDAGHITFLCYYDLEKDQPELVAQFQSVYNGTVESKLCPSGTGYYEQLGTLISSDLSPDLVRYEWNAFPHGISKNMFTSLDDYLDKDDDLWDSVRTVIDDFSYNGKHYIYPTHIEQGYSIFYNRDLVEEYGLEDPFELYENGEWTWDKFMEMMKEWCDADESFYGYQGVTGRYFIATTGEKMIDIVDGKIINNLRNQNIERCMLMLEEMYKENLVNNAWAEPANAMKDRKLLFYGMGTVWAYSTITESLAKAGMEDEIYFVPFPRDPNADKYYININPYGYMVPSNAPNVDGSVKWITMCRTAQTDPDAIQKARKTATSTDTIYFPKCPECLEVIPDDHEGAVCPFCNSALKEKFKVTFTDELYDLYLDEVNPDKFGLVFDNANGFSDDMIKMFEAGDGTGMLEGPLYHGKSFTVMREEYYNAIEAILDPYRELLAS